MPKLPKPLPEPSVDENLVLLAKYTRFLEKLSKNEKYKVLLLNFQKNPSIKTYTKLGLFLRKTADSLKKIAPLGELLIADDRGIPIFNSTILDNFDEKLVGASSSNSFSNSQNGTIIYDNNQETKCVTMCQIDIKSTVLQSEPTCKNLFLNTIYTGKNKRLSTIVIGQATTDRQAFFNHV